MSVFLTGATGFIGGHILRMLSARGYRVTCLVRPSNRALHALEGLPGVQLIEGEWTRPESWLASIAGSQFVINAIGIIRERRHASFAQVHTLSPIALFDAATKMGVKKIVQISALGAYEAAESRFHLTKRAADQYLMQLGIPYVILRPSFVYGPGDHSMAFFSQLARLPLTPVPGDGCYRVQPLYVGDLVKTVSLAIERADLSAVVVDLGGSEVLTFNEMLDLLAHCQEKGRDARKVHIPWSIMAIIARATDLLGGRGPITSDELRMLQRENFTDHLNQFVQLFGFEPLPFSCGISSNIRQPPNPLNRA